MAHVPGITFSALATLGFRIWGYPSPCLLVPVSPTLSLPSPSLHFHPVFLPSLLPHLFPSNPARGLESAVRSQRVWAAKRFLRFGGLISGLSSDRFDDFF